MKTFWGITTFKKHNILKDLLKSLEEFNYIENSIFVIADDNPGESINILNEFPFVEAYLTGNKHGIGYNKNRLIKYCLEKTDCERIVLSDNDIIMIAPGLLQELERASITDKQQHINGFVLGLSGGDGLEETFHRDSLSEHIRYAQGCHGVLLWFTRELLQKVGYINKYPYFYGYEHSDISSRALMVQSYCPTLYPTLLRSPRYFTLNPNDYHVYDVNLNETYGKNAPVFHEILERYTARGINLKNYNHHLDKELIITKDNMLSQEEIINELKLNNKNKKKHK